MKKIIFTLFGLFLIIVFVVFYYVFIKTMSDENVRSYGWKSANCEDMPDLLDFRSGALELKGQKIYHGNVLLGEIIQRKYRVFIEPVIYIRSAEQGRECYYVGKWVNN